MLCDVPSICHRNQFPRESSAKALERGTSRPLLLILEPPQVLLHFINGLFSEISKLRLAWMRLDEIG